MATSTIECPECGCWIDVKHHSASDMEEMKKYLRLAAICVDQVLKKGRVSPATKIMWSDDNPNMYETLGNFRVALKRVAESSTNQ